MLSKFPTTEPNICKISHVKINQQCDASEYLILYLASDLHYFYEAMMLLCILVCKDKQEPNRVTKR